MADCPSRLDVAMLTSFGNWGQRTHDRQSRGGGSFADATAIGPATGSRAGIQPGRSP